MLTRFTSNYRIFDNHINLKIVQSISEKQKHGSATPGDYRSRYDIVYGEGRKSIRKEHKEPGPPLAAATHHEGLGEVLQDFLSRDVFTILHLIWRILREREEELTRENGG